MLAKISTANRLVMVAARRTPWHRSGCGLDASLIWYRPLILIALLCGSGSVSAWAAKASVTTFFQPSGTKSMSVSGLTPGATYSVCLGLIGGTRQCDYKTGTVAKDGTFSVSVPTTAGMAVANFSFAVTHKNMDGSTSTMNWRRIGNTDAMAVEKASEVEKLGLNSLQ